MDPDAVSGKLLRIWIWADQNSVDGNDLHVTDSFLDRLTHRKGFAAAMRHVGWLEGENGRLIFPGFERHNGRTAKERAETNRRVAKHRRRNGSVTDEALQKPLPEKRREEKSTASKEAVGGGSDEHRAVELCDMHPKRDKSGPAMKAALGAIRRHGFEEVRAGVQGYAAAVARWTPAERARYVKNAPEFFDEDLWNQPEANWPGKLGVNGNGQRPARVIDVGGRKAAGVMTAHLFPNQKEP